MKEILQFTGIVILTMIGMLLFVVGSVKAVEWLTSRPAPQAIAPTEPPAENMTTDEGFFVTEGYDTMATDTILTLHLDGVEIQTAAGESVRLNLDKGTVERRGKVTDEDAAKAFWEVLAKSGEQYRALMRDVPQSKP